ncbi:MAG: hypothetical protein J5586_07880 [Clostridia bacterium]|nr:hypothetical protein [Clostridia bacterium]
MDGGYDLDALREAIKAECCAAFFGAGIGPALLEAVEADSMDADELIAEARRMGIDPDQYRI